MKIGIIDYGAGNLRSVGNALATLGQPFEVIDTPKEISNFEKIILPGVGAAGSAMGKLRAAGFPEALRKLTKPFLGICLGMQILGDSSEEDSTECLAILPGKARRFETELKVPHMGWNKVSFTKDCPLTKGVPDESFFYFVHSYYLDTKPKFVVGESIYDISFPAIVRKGNFYGTQFHAEKSGEWGMKILKNFCESC